MDRHKDHRVRRFVVFVHIGDQRDVLEEIDQRRFLVCLLILSRRVDQLLQIGAPLLSLGQIGQLGKHGVVAGLVHYLFDECGDGQRRGGLAEAVHHIDEIHHRVCRGRGDRVVPLHTAQKFHERTALGVCQRLRDLHRFVADAAPGRIDDPMEPEVVVRVIDEREVSDDVLDLHALEEAGAAEHPVRDPGLGEGLLDAAGLRIHPVQHGEILVGAPLCHLIGDRFGDEARLVVLVAETAHTDFLSLGAACPQGLAQSALVVRDDVVGGVQDRFGGAVILLQLDHACVVVVFVEV